MASRRILYVGRDRTLLYFLNNVLEHCQVVRCPDGRGARLFIERDINYALFLIDEKLPDMTGAELERFMRSVPHREQTPIIPFEKSDNLKTLVDEIMQSLGRESHLSKNI